MGDIVGLVEKAAEAIDEEEARRMEEKLRTATFNFEDFLAQMRFIKKLGPLENLLGMIPGMGKIKDIPTDGKELKQAEAIVLSMTLEERRKPDMLNARRRQRIARRERGERDGGQRFPSALSPDAQDDEEHGQDEEAHGQDGRQRRFPWWRRRRFPWDAEDADGRAVLVLALFT